MKNALGFTFIEIIVSIVILSVVLPMGFGLFGSGKQLEMLSKCEMFALGLAENQIESLKATKDYNSLPNSVTASDDYAGKTFATTVTITPVGGYKVINVKVDWGSGNLTLNNIAAPAYSD